MAVIKCPYCGESHWMELYRTSTAAYYPPIYVNGENMNPDGNYTTIASRCLVCGAHFATTFQYGEIVSEGLV